MANSPTKEVVNFIGRTCYNDFSGEVIYATKRLILDTVGCAIGGYSNTVSKIVLELKRELGGTPESTLLVVGDRTSCTSAAYVNAELANALDLEETLLNSSHHSAVAVMAALAVGEKVGASGRQIIEAVALGYDVAARIGLSLEFVEITPDGKSQFAPVAGMGWATFASAVAAGKILNLNEDEMTRTMGLAGTTAPVPIAGKWILELKKSPRPMSKYGFFGPMAEAGVAAALLAQKGFQSDSSILDTERGFWRMVGSKGCNLEIMLGGLGERWFVTETSYKPYPCCRYINGPLDMFLKILRENALRPSDIHSVNVKVPPVTVHSNLDAVLVPQNEVDIQFSIPYCIAIAAYYPEPSPGWQAPDKRRDVKIAELAKKVSVEIDPIADRALKEQLIVKERRYSTAPCEVEVKTNDGKKYKSRAELAKGDPWSNDTIMTDEELKDKFRAFSYGFLRHSKIEKAIQLIYDLDNVKQIGDIMHNLC